MRLNSVLTTPSPGRRSWAWLLVLCACVQAPVLLQAEDAYLSPGRPDGIALLPPPPPNGSEEEATDLASTRAVFYGRTPAEEARAFKDATLTFNIFGRAIGPDFQLDRLPKTAALLKKIKAEIGEIIDIPKDHWKRKRPYQLDPGLSLREPEPRRAGRAIP